MEAILRKDRVNRVQNAPALFVYVPFCKTICTYCDFNVYAHQGPIFESYVRAVKTEIETVASTDTRRAAAKSLAFGGGTPSILPSRLIAETVEAIRSSFQLQAAAEVTLEANPGTVDLDKLKALRQIGVNRLSLGIQSFDDSRLKSLNRNHDSTQSREAYEVARRAGFDNINLDLLFGLPDQTLEDWESTLDLAQDWQPEHLSLYGLQVEEGTALARQIKRGSVHEPDPDTAAEMFSIADEKLIAAGFEHYEISNYARPGFQSLHNLTYWKNQEYIGFGAGAHSYLDGMRYSNLLDPKEYIGRLSRGESVVLTSEPISRELEIGETLMLGLRLSEGIEFSSFKDRFGVDVRDLFGQTIEQLRQWDLLTLTERGMSLSPRGRLISNQVLWRFLPD